VTFYILGPRPIFEMGKYTHLNFVTQTDNSKSLPICEKQPLNGCGQGHMTHFNFLGAVLSLEFVKL